jgi:hypothetical protein
MAWAGGAGAIYSTVEDLHRWNQGLYSGKLINDALLKQASTPVTLPEGVRGLNYGFGLVIADQRGLPVIEHGGGLHGFVSHLAYYPQHKLTVAVLHNSLPPVPGLAPGALSQLIAEFVLWQEMKPRESLSDDSPKTPVNPKLLDDYVGQYDYHPAIMTISKEQDRLFAQLTGQPKFEIFAKSDNEFFWKVVEAQITFMRNEQGQVTHAVHRQGGQTFSAPKLKNRTVVKVEPETLQKYVGKYDYGMRVAILEVTVSGERIFAQLTGQPKLEIVPSSPTTFFWKDVNAEVTFVVGEEGKVEKAIHRQGGRTINAPRIE